MLLFCSVIEFKSVYNALAPLAASTGIQATITGTSAINKEFQPTTIGQTLAIDPRKSGALRPILARWENAPREIDSYLKKIGLLGDDTQSTKPEYSFEHWFHNSCGVMSDQQEREFALWLQTKLGFFLWNHDLRYQDDDLDSFKQMVQRSIIHDELTRIAYKVILGIEDFQAVKKIIHEKTGWFDNRTTFDKYIKNFDINAVIPLLVTEVAKSFEFNDEEQARFETTLRDEIAEEKTRLRCGEGISKTKGKLSLEKIESCFLAVEKGEVLHNPMIKNATRSYLTEANQALLDRAYGEDPAELEARSRLTELMNKKWS